MDLNEYFAKGWATSKEQAALDKEVVETANKLREHTEKCKRLSGALQQARLLLAAGKYEEACEKLKGLET